MVDDFLLYKPKRRCSLMCGPHLTMFNLMSNCCSWITKLQQPVRKVTVLMVGLDNAGKTSTIRGILKAPPRDLGPTSGCIRTELRVDNFLVTLLDVGGGGESRGAWRQLCGEAHGIIFVVDSSDGQRVPEARGLLTDVLQQPRVARKPLLLLANKQDKMDALLLSDLMEALSLEKLVNLSRSPCHIEPSSALVDVRRWTDRKTLRGLRWLLRAVSLDYTDLCARITRDSKRPTEREERERRATAEKGQRRSREEQTHTSKKDLRDAEDLTGKEKNTAKRSTGERSLKKNMKEKQVKIRDAVNSRRAERRGEEEKEEVKGRADIGQRGDTEDISSGVLLPKMRGKTKRKTKIVMKDTLVLPESEKKEEPSAKKGEVESKKKKKSVNVKKKNKINSEGVPAAYSQPVDLSATFDLYRKAILALKARPEQNKGGSSC
ncbi:ADP-ribosylation factor-like protein 13A isoform X2 [Brienomyrus brachyistius]|uniref:ADP-ribosylation factor-like protein 13A isoform X2 n=1 Tax=Brienomyrus brachyistius TaxID=42636 RepID=UPI0020B45DF6|nr:ADP-ribosylation factor-like protein 13A isoform X2 [Brienomyrus brachyistius]